MRKYDAWVAKDKDGEFWLGTLGAEKHNVESNIDNPEWKRMYKFKIVKVKLVEVK